MKVALPRFDFRVEFAGLTDVGRVRATNEDAFALAPEIAVFVMSDGMGGHADGEVASRVAVETVVAALGRPAARAAVDRFAADPSLPSRHALFALLRRSFEKANDAVRAEAERREEPSNMGATLDVALLVRDRAFIAHTGDSRVYLSRATAFIQLTHDHALHESLLAQGKLRHSHPRPARNPLLNAIGLAPTPGVDTIFVELTRGDRLLLCTDGVHGAADNEAVIGQLLRTGLPEDAAGALISYASRRGGRDNATAIVVEVCERFVARSAATDEEPTSGPINNDIAIARHSALLLGLPMPQALMALSAAVEVEILAGERVPRLVAGDMVAYIIVGGQVRMEDGRVLGNSALLFPESLMSVAREGDLPTVEEDARLMRLRADDFTEVCAQDVDLSNALHMRLAKFLARGNR